MDFYCVMDLVSRLMEPSFSVSLEINFFLREKVPYSLDYKIELICEKLPV
jgi:hypothetical protein